MKGNLLKNKLNLLLVILLWLKAEEYEMLQLVWFYFSRFLSSKINRWIEVLRRKLESNICLVDKK